MPLLRKLLLDAWFFESMSSLKRIALKVFLAGATAVHCTAAMAQALSSTFPPGSTVAVHSETRPAQRTASQWLMKMHEASRHRAYTGTFVVMSGGALSSSRIWHVCDGDQQVERVEALSGAPQTTYRRNDEVLTFLPMSKVAVSERREFAGLFPALLRSRDSSIAAFYLAEEFEPERVAGFESDVVRFVPRDQLRFGYRVWSEKSSGLAVKLQTLDTDGRVLEQVAFSELRLDAPVSMKSLQNMMQRTQGYRVEKKELIKTDASAEGWVLKTGVPGFNPMNCYRRFAQSAIASKEYTLQCVFSDGLASVSLFIEPYDRQRHPQEVLFSMGATHTLARRVPSRAGQWWLTAVGEVPIQTLGAFAQQLERRR